MITSRVFICAIPPENWAQANLVGNFGLSLGALATDALSIERRIKKGVAKDVERVRYDLCCARLEEIVRSIEWVAVDAVEEVEWSGSRVSTLRLPQSYLDELADLIRQQPTDREGARLGSSFFPPDSLRHHVEQFSAAIEQRHRENSQALQFRLGFATAASKRGWGLVEIQDSFVFVRDNGEYDSVSYEPGVSAQSNVLSPLETDSQGGLVDILVSRIADAVEHDVAVNFSNFPHSVISDALREVVYQRPSQQPTQIRVVYNDGSEAAAFPVRCLKEREARDDAAESVRLRVALISMRHLELDKEVDMCWLRNREASQSRTLAEADAQCFERSLEQLHEARALGALSLEMLQTGYQPAVLGFYRALVVELMQRNGTPPLVVVPSYYNRAGWRSGTGRAWA